MSFKTEVQLLVLSKRINDRLDEIHDEAIRGFRTLARSVGQRTRERRSVFTVPYFWKYKP